MTQNDGTYTGDYTYFDSSGARFLFPFTDIEPELLEDEIDLGFGWCISRVTWSELESYGVIHHLKDWQNAHFGTTQLHLPNAYVRDSSSYKLGEALPKDEWRFCMIWCVEQNVGIGPDSISQALAISDLAIQIGARSDGGSEPKNCCNVAAVCWTGRSCSEYTNHTTRNQPNSSKCPSSFR